MLRVTLAYAREYMIQHYAYAPVSKRDPRELSRYIDNHEFRFEGDRTTDTNKDGKTDKYMLTVNGLGLAGISEKQIFDCMAGAKPVTMLWTNLMQERVKIYQN